MALLYRFTKLNDRLNTGIFTFIITRSLIRDVHRNATTKDFYYGYHQWAISLTRGNEKGEKDKEKPIDERSLGVYLVLRNPSPHTDCYADYTFTLLNREHFSRNEAFSEKGCKFNSDKNVQGIEKWLLISEIKSRKFGNETGEFLLELSIGNINTVYRANLHVAASGESAIKSGKFESPSFGFGLFDWNVSIVVHNYATNSGLNSGTAAITGGGVGGNNSNASQSGTTSITNSQNGYAEGQASGSQDQGSFSGRIIYIFLNRLSGFDHPCRVRYKVMVGNSKHHEDSGDLDQISDAGGRIRGWQMHGSLSDMVHKDGSVPVTVELMCCNAISEAKVPLLRSTTPAINCYDRNKQSWCLETELESEYLGLKLFFMDLHTVPKNHMRYISWIAYILVRDPKTGVRESIAINSSPQSNYYTQDGIDMGCVMETSLPVAKVKEESKVYFEQPDNKLTVHVEWMDSIMLFNQTYTKYDDISRNHCQQMRREIQALTAENANYEKLLLTKTPAANSHHHSQSHSHSQQQSSSLQHPSAINVTSQAANGRGSKSTGSTASSDSSDLTSNHSGRSYSHHATSGHHSTSSLHHLSHSHPVSASGYHHHEPLSHRASSEQGEATSPASDMLVRHGSARAYSRSPVRATSGVRRNAYMNGNEAGTMYCSSAVQYGSKLSISPRNSLDVPTGSDSKAVCLPSPRALSMAQSIRASLSTGYFFSDNFPTSGRIYNEDSPGATSDVLVPSPVSPRFRQRDRTPTNVCRLGPSGSVQQQGYYPNQLSPFHVLPYHHQGHLVPPVYDSLPPTSPMLLQAGNWAPGNPAYENTPKIEYYD